MKNYNLRYKEPTFKNPQFIKDKDCDQLICFEIFKRKLEQKFTPITPEAETEMIGFISDLCEVFYQYEYSTRKMELLDQGLPTVP